MGKIIMPPRNIYYPYPKALGKKGGSTGKIIGRAMVLESGLGTGDYMRIVDYVNWFPDNYKEIRFCQFYRKPNGGDQDWIYGQGAGHMSPETFRKLIEKARSSPDYGTFEGIFDNIVFK